MQAAQGRQGVCPRECSSASWERLGAPFPLSSSVSVSVSFSLFLLFCLFLSFSLSLSLSLTFLPLFFSVFFSAYCPNYSLTGSFSQISVSALPGISSGLVLDPQDATSNPQKLLLPSFNAAYSDWQPWISA